MCDSPREIFMLKVLKGGLAAALVIAGATFAQAQTYPAKPIKLIVPFPPGGGTDNLSRYISDRLNKALGWNFIVENKPGAAGNLALDTTAKSAPDGYTMVMAQTDNVVLNPLLYDKLSYDPVKDLAPVAMLASGTAVLVVKADSPHKSIGDIVAAAKAKPGTVSFGSPGIGTAAHLALELWQGANAIKLNHIPYRGIAQSLPDLLGGQVDMYMGSIPTMLGQIKEGKVRAIAVTGTQRSALLPDVPTYTEAGAPGVVIASVWGLMVPANTPAAIIGQLNAEVNKILDNPESKAQILSTGAEVLRGSPKDLETLYASDRARLAPVVKASGIRLE